MKKTTKSGALSALALAFVLPLLLGGCRTNAQTGSLIGAGAGALGGYVIGNEMDKGSDDGHRHHGGRHHHRW
jgi:hypothetical protein